MIVFVLQKIVPDHVPHSYEFERAVADLIIMVSPFAPSFASELWAGVQSVRARMKTDHNLVR